MFVTVSYFYYSLLFTIRFAKISWAETRVRGKGQTMANALAYCTAVFIAKVKLFTVQTLLYFSFVVIKREIFKVFPEGTTK